MKRLFPILLLVAATVRAEEPVSFSGLVDFAYLWNPNRPANHENFVPGTGTSGKRSNEVMLNLAQVQWARAASAEQPVGFTLSLVAGEGTEVVLRSLFMWDLIFVALTLVLFALAAAYVRACEKL